MTVPQLTLPPWEDVFSDPTHDSSQAAATWIIGFVSIYKPQFFQHVARSLATRFLKISLF